MISNLFKMFPITNSFTNHIYLIYVYKEYLALINLQGVVYHKTKPNQTTPKRLNSFSTV